MDHVVFGRGFLNISTIFYCMEMSNTKKNVFPLSRATGLFQCHQEPTATVDSFLGTTLATMSAASCNHFELQHMNSSKLPNFNLLFELSIVWHFTKRDIGNVSLPAFFSTVAALVHSGYSMWQAFLPLSLSFIYSWSILAFFNISNQICDMEEDRIDKPDRPLVKGMVSVQGARMRWVFFGIVGLLIAANANIPVVPYTVFFYMLAIVNNHLTAKKFWQFRLSMTSIGVTLPIVIGWNMVAPVPKELWIWILYLQVYWCLIGPIQDLRDLDGDRKTGRNSFPLLFGQHFTRRMAGLGGVAMGVLQHFVLKRMTKPSLLRTCCEVVLTSLSLILTTKIYNSSSAQSYRTCWKCFMYYYCIQLIGGCILIVSP